MGISELSIRLLFLFLPGIIATIIIDSLTDHNERKSTDFFVYSFILGAVSYLLIGVLTIFIKNETWKMNFLECIYDVNQKISAIEVGIGCVSGIIIALLVSYCINNKLLHRFARKYGISRRFGEMDVWGYIFNSKDIEWVLLRDYDKDLMYEGWIGAFSSTVKEGELFLRDVIVYSAYTGTSGRRFRKHPDTKPEVSGHFAG